MAEATISVSQLRFMGREGFKNLKEQVTVVYGKGGKTKLAVLIPYADYKDIMEMVELTKRRADEALRSLGGPRGDD